MPHHIKQIFTKEFLNEIKSKLISQEKSLEAEERRLESEDPFKVRKDSLRSSEFLEEANEEVNHGVFEAERSFLRKILVETRTALTKLKLGKYGICEICSQTIEKARLKAYPQAKYCLQCEEREDKRSEHVAHL